MALAFAGNGTITGLSVGGLPDGTVDADTLASGTGGKILQIVSLSKSDTYTVSLSAGAMSSSNVTGLDCSITPSATSSKILVTGHVNISMTNPDANASCSIQLLRGGTILADANGDVASNRPRVLGTVPMQTVYESGTVGFSFVDSPSSTSSQTYGFRLHNNRGDTATICVNRTGDDADNAYSPRGASSVVLMEISA